MPYLASRGISMMVLPKLKLPPGLYRQQQTVWTVNLLCTELETRLSPPLLETNLIDLHGCPISVERQTIRKVPGPEALIFQGREQCRKRVEIRFLTPTAFKQAGRSVATV